MLGAGFDPTQSGSHDLGIVSWVREKGLFAFSLFGHLAAETLLSAGCIASALYAERKILPVTCRRTEYHELKTADRKKAMTEREELEQELRQAKREKAECESRLELIAANSSEAMRAEKAALDATIAESRARIIREQLSH
ncbi:hypothetical protein RGUI_4335 (plasmid) [Rhodovulum sp. P5]|nr:hypothetical protein RGUI_4335 [Rhodovulum sp. P5]